VIRNYSEQILLLAKRLGIAYLLYFITRLIFYAYNRPLFPAVGIADFFRDAVYGLRFDSFSIAATNSLFILLSLIPGPLFRRTWYRRVLYWLFMAVNTLCVCANLVDTGYFAFIRKRSTADLFAQLGGQTDVLKLVPQFAADFWLLVVFLAAIVFGVHKLYMRTRLRDVPGENSRGAKVILVCVGMFILTAGLAVLAIRGGVQRVPIDIVSAGAVAGSEEAPIVLNTPFTLIKTVDHRPLEALNYYTADELDAIYSPIHHYRDSVFKKQNVVVLILESFSKEYTKLGGKPGLTPFLDSLMGHSLIFTNGYSNGTKSIEGIPAILSSLPSLMDDPLINSMYANNRQSSFASLLRGEGYETAFFHGGINGTMNFNDWAKLAGYQAYLGRNEYMNDDDFDGFWGIWDEPFLQFAAMRMGKMKQPFHAAVFTLSSHHPYFVPKEYKGKFPEGPLENSVSIRYADHSLRRFFATASKMDWYKNTLFVLVADHCGISDSPFFSNPVGFLSIPILFYRPDNSLKGVHGKVSSQIDILPHAMRLLGYNKPFFAFGEGFRRPRVGFEPWYHNGTHHVFSDSLTYWYTGGELQNVYNYTKDSLLHHNLKGNYPFMDSTITTMQNAFLQSYHYVMINNLGAAEAYRDKNTGK
jgi:arylsulfatase A-like enzyme